MQLKGGLQSQKQGYVVVSGCGYFAQLSINVLAGPTVTETLQTTPKRLGPGHRKLTKTSEN